MDLALTPPEERYDRLPPSGRPTITLADTLRLVTSLRPVGTHRPAVVARFAAFFTAAVAKAFLSPRRSRRPE
jgi:hypothetical protein